MRRSLAICWVIAALVFGGLAVAASLDPLSGPETDVSVYLVDDADAEESEAVRALVAGVDGIRDVEYVSKEDAFAEFASIYADQPALLENMSADVLPASVRAVAEDERARRRLRDALKDVTAVDEITDVAAGAKDGERPRPGPDVGSLFAPQEPLPSVWTTARNGFGIGALALLVPLTAIAVLMHDRRGRRPCPECAEPIKVQARRCPHCGSEVGAEPRS